MLRKWARSKDIGAFRLYDGDIPEVPLAVDLYREEGGDEKGRALVIALYERPYEKDEAEEAEWLGLMAAAASEALSVDPRRIFLKTRKRMKGLSQYGRQGEESAEAIIREAGLRFRVNFSDYLDTGLFLDHRPARSVVRAIAAQKRVLNLFSYTGSFSVYAAAGGAASVTSVDLSNTYLAWARENIKLNGFRESVHHAEKADAMAFLERSRRAGARWDIIVADPPTFSNSTMAKDDFDVNRDWPVLLDACSGVLEEGGLILFSTNSRRLKWAPDKISLPWEDLSERSVPRDFRDRKIHRCWLAGDLSLVPKELWD